MKYTHFDAAGNFVNMVEWDGITPFKVEGTLIPHEPAHDSLWPQTPAEPGAIMAPQAPQKLTIWQRFLALLGSR